MLQIKILKFYILALMVCFSNSYAVNAGSPDDPSDSLDVYKNAEMRDVNTYKEIPLEFRSNLGNFYDSYFRVSESLAIGDSMNAKRNALEMFEMTETFLNSDIIDPTFSQSNDQMRTYKSMIEEANTLAEQRSLFGRFSGDMSEMIGIYGLPGQKIYVMETDDTIIPGNKLMWLSNGQGSSNPYYGSTPGNNVRVLRGWNFQTP